jgi:hypothetical protein
MLQHFGIWNIKKWDNFGFFCWWYKLHESIRGNTQRYTYGVLITVFDISNLSMPSKSTHWPPGQSTRESVQFCYVA